MEFKRMTLEEHHGVTSANYYLSSLSPRAFRRAARKLRNDDKKELANLFYRHADDETGHHYWAWDDLMAMDKPLLPMTVATNDLLLWVEEIINSDSPWRILALSTIAERVAPSLNIENILPDSDTPASYISKHIEADLHHQDEIDNMLDCLTDEERKVVDELTPKAEKLYYNHLLMGLESGKTTSLSAKLCRRSNGLYLLTHDDPELIEVKGTNKKDFYAIPGDPLNVNNLCKRAVGLLGWNLSRHEYKNVKIYFLPDYNNSEDDPKEKLQDDS